MKRNLFIVLIFLILTTLFCAYSSDQGIASDKPLNQHLITQSIELTCTMDSLAQSDEYIMFFSTQPELRDFIMELGADEYMSPNKAVLIKVSDEIINSIIEESVGKLNLPDDAYEMVVTRMCSSVPNIINAQQGANTIMATSILSISKAFQQHKDFTDNTYVILLYDNYCSVTFYRKSGEGILSASTTFLFLSDDMRKSVTEETVAEYLSEQPVISGVEIEYVEGNKIAEYK